MHLPPPLSWLYAGWMAFSHVLGMIMSKIILTLLWIAGFGSYAVILTIIHLIRKTPPKTTCWQIPPEEFEGRLKYQF
ncbi:hypothetical protein A3H22_02730 [Candidatus Peribacteria bacterium RIFCSPLOWO2_12_FULL_55_15]|nr:MAG: hypothetical protein A2789_04115 [Candidatus Peribacteria bacterium RIFCSPHIGHO2_01_FULL_54_22]OGJ63261.1 MAG: hypothetical protein A3D12_02940 [Candidatus Peribacteria bacterium RIFCSPHIGHO2_02_FULL_55_24]OGJ63783.1 MAG: hypothetical protein A3E47_00060 [Candidatus Peribacteria bacterium RIFCSPHIGHO2_12_FULL_54_10]OGJ70119.1 MAG: hypothetical protein A3H90_03335 [Candidatus Peribacteria bacterium RIFCSPLOWO2_02_FULL_55_36]OGJ70572.1 MAG: hypothetical protein A3H22_02730 [Candidatus Per